MKIDAGPVARERDIGRMAVHAGSCEHMDPVDGHALRLVDRGGVAIIDMGIVFCVKGDAAPVVGASSHCLRGYVLDGARSEARRVGKECVSTCRSRCSPYH